MNYPELSRELFIMKSGKLGIMVTLWPTNVKVEEEISGYLIISNTSEGSYCWDTPEHRSFLKILK